jgi:hypothetical protein
VRVQMDPRHVSGKLTWRRSAHESWLKPEDHGKAKDSSSNPNGQLRCVAPREEAWCCRSHRPLPPSPTLDRGTPTRGRRPFCRVRRDMRHDSTDGGDGSREMPPLRGLIFVRNPISHALTGRVSQLVPRSYAGTVRDPCRGRLSLPFGSGGVAPKALATADFRHASACPLCGRAVVIPVKPAFGNRPDRRGLHRCRRSAAAGHHSAVPTTNEMMSRTRTVVVIATYRRSP